jgi:hypothetical protein
MALALKTKAPVRGQDADRNACERGWGTNCRGDDRPHRRWHGRVILWRIGNHATQDGHRGLRASARWQPPQLWIDRIRVDLDDTDLGSLRM